MESRLISAHFAHPQFAIIPPISLIVYLSAMLAVERNHPGLLQTERRDLICGFRSTGAAWYADRITPIIIGVFLVVSLCLSCEYDCALNYAPGLIRVALSVLVHDHILSPGHSSFRLLKRAVDACSSAVYHLRRLCVPYCAGLSLPHRPEGHNDASHCRRSLRGNM